MAVWVVVGKLARAAGWSCHVTGAVRKAVGFVGKAGAGRAQLITVIKNRPFGRVKYLVVALDLRTGCVDNLKKVDAPRSALLLRRPSRPLRFYICQKMKLAADLGGGQC